MQAAQANCTLLPFSIFLAAFALGKAYKLHGNSKYKSTKSSQILEGKRNASAPFFGLGKFLPLQLAVSEFSKFGLHRVNFEMQAPKSIVLWRYSCALTRQPSFVPKSNT
jgi:hypothetical protein